VKFSVITCFPNFSKPAHGKMVMEKSGFLYVYTSNESPQDVFFDNVVVMNAPGPVLEETHYYPFGLAMSGISTKAVGKLENKRGYNGNELQNKEFSNGSGLELYDFNARTYDQQIGRFIQIDPLTEEGQEDLSPYHFAYNNPILYGDPDGKLPVAPLIYWAVTVGADYLVATGAVAGTIMVIDKLADRVDTRGGMIGTGNLTFAPQITISQSELRTQQAEKAAKREAENSVPVPESSNLPGNVALKDALKGNVPKGKGGIIYEVPGPKTPSGKPICWATRQT
jgi:RHS repeat-associated protein